MHFELIHTGHVIVSLLLVRQVKASFVVKGDRGGDSGLHPFYVLWMQHRQRRASDYIHGSWTRTGKAWSLGLEGGERKETYRKGTGPRIHVTGGNKKHWDMFDSHNYLFTPVLLYVREDFAVSSATSSLQASVSALCRQPAREGWQCHTATELPVKTRYRRKYLLLLLTKKRGTTSGAVKRRGHTPVEESSGQRNGAIVLQLRLNRVRSGALLISLRGSLQRPSS